MTALFILIAITYLMMGIGFAAALHSSIAMPNRLAWALIIIFWWPMFCLWAGMELGHRCDNQ